jgi:hypothetical protein
LVAREAGKRADLEAAALLDLAMQDKDGRIRAEARFGLALRGDRSSAQELQKLFHFKNATVREHAVTALGRLSLVDGISVAFEGLNDPSPKVRQAAILACPFIGDPRLLGAIAAVADDPRTAVREQVEGVFRLATGETVPYPRKATGTLLQRITAAMQPARRYFCGKLWTLGAMAGTLLNPVESLFGSANLVSATGQDFGYDPDRDLLNNLDAIEQWERFAQENAERFAEGRWYYQGRMIA